MPKCWVDTWAAITARCVPAGWQAFDRGVHSRSNSRDPAIKRNERIYLRLAERSCRKDLEFVKLEHVGVYMACRMGSSYSGASHVSRCREQPIGSVSMVRRERPVSWESLAQGLQHWRGKAQSWSDHGLREGACAERREHRRILE